MSDFVAVGTPSHPGHLFHSGLWRLQESIGLSCGKLHQMSLGVSHSGSGRKTKLDVVSIRSYMGHSHQHQSQLQSSLAHHHRCTYARTQLRQSQ